MTTKNMKINRLALTWWVYLTLIPGLTFIPFAYAGFSSKDRKLVYCAYIYFLPCFFAAYYPELATIVWLGGIIHAFSIKNKYINRKLELKASDFNRFRNVETTKQTSENQKEIVKIKIEEEVKEEKQSKVILKEKEENKYNNIVKENKAVKLDLGEESNQLIDINHCEESELEKLPYINSIIAKKAIQQREAIGSFSSVEEFGISIGLKPHIIEKIRPLVIVREREKEKDIKEDNKDKFRVIDL